MTDTENNAFSRVTHLCRYLNAVISPERGIGPDPFGEKIFTAEQQNFLIENMNVSTTRIGGGAEENFSERMSFLFRDAPVKSMMAIGIMLHVYETTGLEVEQKKEQPVCSLIKLIAFLHNNVVNYSLIYDIDEAEKKSAFNASSVPETIAPLTEPLNMTQMLAICEYAILPELERLLPLMAGELNISPERLKELQQAEQGVLDKKTGYELIKPVEAERWRSLSAGSHVGRLGNREAEQSRNC